MAVDIGELDAVRQLAILYRRMVGRGTFVMQGVMWHISMMLKSKIEISHDTLHRVASPIRQLHEQSRGAAVKADDIIGSCPGRARS